MWFACALPLQTLLNLIVGAIEFAAPNEQGKKKQKLKVISRETGKLEKKTANYKHFWRNNNNNNTAEERNHDKQAAKHSLQPASKHTDWMCDCKWNNHLNLHTNGFEFNFKNMKLHYVSNDRLVVLWRKLAIDCSDQIHGALADNATRTKCGINVVRFALQFCCFSFVCNSWWNCFFSLTSAPNGNACSNIVQSYQILMR